MSELSSSSRSQAATPPDSARPVTTSRRLIPLEVLLFAAWSGLAAGLLEVGVRLLWRRIEPTNHLFLMTRHFVWLCATR